MEDRVHKKEHAQQKPVHNTELEFATEPEAASFDELGLETATPERLNLELAASKEPGVVSSEELVAQDPTSVELSDAEALLKTAGKIALSGAVAASLTAALAEPPRTDLMALPEPTPIVQVLQAEEEEPPEPEDEEKQTRESRLKRILRLLRFLVLGALLAAVILFGVLKGCASCSAGMIARNSEEEEQTSTEDDNNQTIPAARISHIFLFV